MVDDTRTVDSFDAPYGKQIEIIENAEESVTFLRVRIREKSRFTILDLDPVTAERWGRAMMDWAAAQGVGEKPG